MKKIILRNQRASKHLSVLMANVDSRGKYIHPTEDEVVGGFFFEEASNKWIAFCNRSNDCNVEEFATNLGAFLFVCGEED